MRLCLSCTGIDNPLRSLACLILLHKILIKRKVAVVGLCGIGSEISQRAHVFGDHLRLDKSACKAEAELVGRGDRVLLDFLLVELQSTSLTPRILTS